MELFTINLNFGLQISSKLVSPTFYTDWSLANIRALKKVQNSSLRSIELLDILRLDNRTQGARAKMGKCFGGKYRLDYFYLVATFWYFWKALSMLYQS